MTEKILIVGPAWVGDMVMAHSLFQVLAQQRNSPIIDVLAPAWTLPLLSRFPEVRRGIELPFAHGKLALGERWQLGKSLRSEQYDQAIVLPRSLKSAIIPFGAKVKRRTGYLGEIRYGLLNDIRPLDKNLLPRTIDRFVALGLNRNKSKLENPPFPHLITSIENADRALVDLGHTVTDSPVLGLCPGAEYGPAKRWPTTYFAEVAKTKLNEGWQVWIFGSGKDKEISKEIQNLCNNRCLDLVGKTSINDAVDLLAQCKAVVTNDSGLMHVAAAVKTKVIAIFGSSDFEHTPPLSDNASKLTSDIPCRPCMARTCRYGHYDCLTKIEPAKILDSLDKA